MTTATQAEFGKLVEEQVAEFNKQVVTTLDKMVKTAPAGSEVGIAAFKSGIAAVNSAYDNLSKVAKQFTEATQSNIEAVAKQAVERREEGEEGRLILSNRHATRRYNSARWSGPGRRSTRTPKRSPGNQGLLLITRLRVRPFIIPHSGIPSTESRARSHPA